MPGRLRALRKSEEAIRAAQDKVRKKAKRNGRKLKPETLDCATCVILSATFPEDGFPAGGDGFAGVASLPRPGGRNG